jgi:DNA-binding response OmpR family regulator
MKILIVEDETILLETVEMRFRKEGFSTFTAQSAEDGMRIFKRIHPDIMVLDIMLPQRSGLDLCRALRKESTVPIIFLTARVDEADRIEGLNIGGDDYVTKPFNLSELVARVKAVLRRATGDVPYEVVEAGDLVVDPRSHTVTLDSRSLKLSPKEFSLLHFLARNKGQVFSRDALLDRVWGKDAYVEPRTVDVHIRWLRNQIEKDASSPERIITLRGVGYKFVG